VPSAVIGESIASVAHTVSHVSTVKAHTKSLFAHNSKTNGPIAEIQTFLE
jgi:hypothetical protein